MFKRKVKGDFKIESKLLVKSMIDSVVDFDKMFHKKEIKKETSHIPLNEHKYPGPVTT